MQISLRLLLCISFVGATILTTSCGEAGAPRSKVNIVGYINATVGCQADTIKYLENFAAKHAQSVSLAIVDFGSEAGYARWRRDGYGCETIVINGANQFRVRNGHEARIVVLKMPEGVRWTFDDLSAVLQQELKSPGASILSDADADKIARRTPVAIRRSRSKGKEVGEVVVAAQTVFRFTAPLNGKSSARRAEHAVGVLKRLYANGLQASDVRVKRQGAGETAVGIIVAKGQEIATVTDAEGEVINRPAVQAAQFWAFNLRDALRMLGR